MTATVSKIPAADSPAALVASEVRAALARQRIPLTQMRRAVGGSYAYWHRRVTGVTPLDVEDLQVLADFLGCAPADLLPPHMREGRRTPQEQWAPSGSNRRPTDYKSVFCWGSGHLATILQFPQRSTDDGLKQAS